MTFSLLGFDEVTGSVGIAGAASIPSAGASLPYFADGIGLIVTQNYPNVLLARSIGAALEQNRPVEPPGHFADILTPFEPAFRQYGYITFDGRLFAWTGSGCGACAGQIVDSDCAAVGHDLPGRDVLAAMVDRFQTTGGPFPDRLASALAAGEAVAMSHHDPAQAASIARNGYGSAYLMVFDPLFPDTDRLPLDIRIDWQDGAVGALADLLTVRRTSPQPMPLSPSLSDDMADGAAYAPSPAISGFPPQPLSGPLSGGAGARTRPSRRPRRTS